MRRPSIGGPPASGVVRRSRREIARRRRRRKRVAFLTVVTVAAGSAALAAVTPLLSRRPGRGARQVAPAAPHRSRRAHRTLVTVAGAQPPRHERRVSSVPILMYHVINRPPSDAPFPGLYVVPAEFAAQMAALAAAGYRGVTLDQVARNWQTTTARRPIVISFDNGYRSQYTYALPVLRRLGWPAV